MREATFSDARSMEEAALEVMAGGGLVLTPTGRLADRYRHAFRTARMGASAGGPCAWETPAASELRRWVRERFDLLWEERLPPGKGAQLRLWRDAAEAARERDGVPPPEGLLVAPSLYGRLQGAYDRMREHALPNPPSEEGTLQGWRERVFARYEGLLSERGFLPWHGVVRAVARGLGGGHLAVPKRVALALGSEPTPLYAALFEGLESVSDLEVWRLGKDPEHPPSCRLVASEEEECRLAVAEAVRAWGASGGTASLALVALEPTLAERAGTYLTELAGGAPTPEGEARFGVPDAAPLTSHPLVQAALLPLAPPHRDIVKVLAQWVRSPFADPGRIEGFEARVLKDLAERRMGVSWEQAASKAAREFPELAPLLRLATPLPRTVGTWLKLLRDAWRGAGFFWKGGSPEVRDACAAAEDALQQALEDLEAHCSDLEVDRNGALAWVAAACEGLGATASKFRAGIQVLGPTEAFGLPLDGLWVLGTHGRALPAAPLPDPLLVPSERVAVAGGPGPQRSWAEGAQLLRHLLAGAGGTSRAAFSRSLASADGKQPTLPCPFVEDRFEDPDGDRPFGVDIWGTDRDTWAGMPWLAGASRGLARPRDPSAPGPDDCGLPLPGEVRATELDDLLQCPFRYFARRHLGLGGTQEPSGLSRAYHGTLVHEILDGFARWLHSEAGRGWPGAFGEAWAALRGLAKEVLGRLGEGPVVEAEEACLLGDDEEGTRGFLRPWLEAEADRARKGWFLQPPSGEREHPFEGLELLDGTLKVRGKADRIDRREGAAAVWDYKTGTPPEAKEVLVDLNQGQLPAYVAALRAGLLARPGEGEEADPDRPVEAGYIVVKPRPGGKPFHLPIEPAEEGWDGFLVRWQERLASRAQPARKGLYPADPVRSATEPGEDKTACTYCEFACLCGRFDAPAPGEGGEEDA